MNASVATPSAARAIWQQEIEAAAKTFLLGRKTDSRQFLQVVFQSLERLFDPNESIHLTIRWAGESHLCFNLTINREDSTVPTFCVAVDGVKYKLRSMCAGCAFLCEPPTPNPYGDEGVYCRGREWRLRWKNTVREQELIIAAN